MAYRQKIMNDRTIKGLKSYAGETLEKKLQRVMTNGDAIKDKAPLVYTDRKDGVLPDYNMRTDKYEYLVDGYDKAAKAKRAKRDGVADATKALDKENARLQKDGAGGSADKGSGATGD